VRGSERAILFEVFEVWNYFGDPPNPPHNAALGLFAALGFPLPSLPLGRSQ
tara:strand:- start:570 stop:722 length:153 start_codon:yes stop_codon:yes gene_type:complete